jgi:hypothetical protein
MARLLAALAALALLEQAQPGITATSATSALLGPSMYRPLAPGAIAPHGWLLTQLKLQANGMAGHYAMFWEDVAQSWWVGGSDGDTSSAPYWLNGFVPLAYQLKAAGIEQLPPTKCTARSDSSDSSSAHRHVGSGEGGSAMPVGPVRPLDQVKTYVDGILKRVGTDGWIGPPVNGNGDVYYVATNVAFSLIQWAEAENVIGNAQPLRNVSQILLRHYLLQHELMQATPLTSFAQARWQDMTMNLAWLLDRGAGTPQQQATLLQLAELLHSQGTDWDGWFASNFTACASESGPAPAVSQCRHNVNNAQALKSAAAWYRFTGNTSLHALSRHRTAAMDVLFGSGFRPECSTGTNGCRPRQPGILPAASKPVESSSRCSHTRACLLRLATWRLRTGRNALHSMRCRLRLHLLAAAICGRTRTYRL